MRIMVIQPGPSFSVADVANGVIQGLRQHGHQVVNFNLDARLTFYTAAHVPLDDGGWRQAFEHDAALTLAVKGIYGACYEFWPELIVIISGFYTPPRLYEVLRARGHTVVLWCTESPYEDTRQIEQAGLADLCVINDPTNLDRFRAVQPNTHYISHSYDPRIHYRRPPDPDNQSEFCFVGTGYPSRIEFLEQVDFHGIHVLLAGNWELIPDDSPLAPFLAHKPGLCVDNTDTVVYYSNTKASANIYRREIGDGMTEAERGGVDLGWAMGPREVELAAVGTFFLTEARGENREVLPMVPTFEGPQDFGEQLRWWLAHDDARDEIAGKAQAAVAGMTFEANTARMLQLLDH